MGLEDRVYECEVCGLAFPRPSALAEHKVRLEGFWEGTRGFADGLMAQRGSHPTRLTAAAGEADEDGIPERSELSE